MPISAIAWILVASFTYFAGARLGLSLLTQPEGVAVFWPASGLAAGAILPLGKQRRWMVATGVFIATIAANLLAGRGVAMASAFGLCNAGEALLFAAILQRPSSPQFNFENLRAGLWFLAAAGIAPAVSAAAAATAITIGGAAPSWFQLWQAWWESDAIGILMFAPFLIAIAQPESTTNLRFREEGILALAVLVAITGFTFFAEPSQAALQVPIPVAVIFPVLLWMATRTGSKFLTAGLLVVSLMIVWATTNGLGHFGNPLIPLPDRIFAARVTLLSISTCALLLIAFFNEHKAIEDRLRASERQFRNLAAVSPVGIYRTSAAGRCIYVNTRCLEITGMNEAQAVGLGWADSIHEDDRASVMAQWREAVRLQQPISVEYRFQKPSGEPVWVHDQAIPEYDQGGKVTGYVGTLSDITGRKRSEERVGILVGEVNHRAKNLLSVAQAVAFHTAREETPADFADTFNRRIAGLATSHDLLSLSAWEGVNAADLVHSQLAHFGNLLGSRITFEGPAVALKPAAAQAIGMALHELATNAGKYGALSTSDGSVRIAWWIDSAFHMSWTETGGPPVKRPKKPGFGYKVMVEMATHELDAAVTLEYPMEGLKWNLSTPTAKAVENFTAARLDKTTCAC
jgi:PAS domain S-box-containing protein